MLSPSTRFEKFVVNQFTDMKLTLHIIQESVNELKEFLLKTTEITGPVDDMEATFLCIFPLQNEDDVTNFEQKLEDKDFKNTLEIHLSKLGGKTEKENVKRILCKTFSNKLASEYSWLGAKKKENVL